MIIRNFNEPPQIFQNRININEQNKKIIEKLSKEKKIIDKNSSLDVDLFLSPEISDYKCLICENIPNPENAHEAICCGILFCKDCLLKWVAQNPRCPICKKVLKNEEKFIRNIKEKNKIIYKTFLRYKMKCPYGCEWKGELANLENHLKECDKGVKECKYKDIGCEYKEEKEKMKEHEEKCDKLHLDLAMKFIKENQRTEEPEIINDNIIDNNGIENNIINNSINSFNNINRIFFRRLDSTNYI